MDRRYVQQSQERGVSGKAGRRGRGVAWGQGYQALVYRTVKKKTYQAGNEGRV